MVPYTAWLGNFDFENRATRSTVKTAVLPSFRVTATESPRRSAPRRLKTAGSRSQVTWPAMTAGPSSPGVALLVNQPARDGSFGTSMAPSASSPRCTSFERTSILGIDTDTGSDSGSTSPLVRSRTSDRAVAAADRRAVGSGVLGDGCATSTSEGAAAGTGSGLGGAASAAPISRTPAVPSPTAIVARARRPGGQRGVVVIGGGEPPLRGPGGSPGPAAVARGRRDRDGDR